MRKADLSPPLGWRGGPCLVVERIEDSVRTPYLRSDLSEKVEEGEKLSNADASKIYDMLAENGGGVFKKIRITPHAQYRMDQRGVTVGDIQTSLKHLSRKLNDWKSRRDPQYNQVIDTITGRGTFEWVDDKLGNLVVVFAGFGRDTVSIVTTYWKGLPDPRPQSCGAHPRHAAMTPGEMSGYQTYVKDPHPTKSDTGEGKYPTQGLPSPPWSRSKPTGPKSINGPGESGSDSSGTVHKDKVRTPGTPGGQYDGGATHPTPAYNETGITPNRRPSLTAFLFEGEDVLAGYQPRYPSPHPSGADRQRDQKGEAKRYDARNYQRNRGERLTDAKRRYDRLKTNNQFMNRREKAKERPDRHERRPGGPSSIEERSREQREENARTGYTVRTTPKVRQRKRRGPDKWRARRRYQRDRTKERLKARKRYKKLKKNPAFKRQQKIRRQNPERFKRRLGAVLTAPEIAFVVPSLDMALGYVRSVSPLSGLVTFSIELETSTQVHSLPVDSFMDGVVFLSDEDIETMLDLLESEIGWSEEEDDEDDIGPHLSDGLRGTWVDDYLLDPTDDDLYYGAVNRLTERFIRASFYRSVEPPVMSPDQISGRGTSLEKIRMDRKNQKPGDNSFPHQDAVMNSNPGSRVLPTGKGHVNKQGAKIQDIRKGCSPSLLDRSRGINLLLASQDAAQSLWRLKTQGSNYDVVLQKTTEGVKVSCSCDFWRWQGPEHWAKQGGYLYGNPRGTATRPSVKDPQSHHRACKHVLAMFQLVESQYLRLPGYADPVTTEVSDA